MIFRFLFWQVNAKGRPCLLLAKLCKSNGSKPAASVVGNGQALGFTVAGPLASRRMTGPVRLYFRFLISGRATSLKPKEL